MPTGIDRTVTLFYAQTLWAGIEKGYGRGVGLDYETPDHNMLAALQKNVYQFSAAKNYSQLKALTEALVDEGGKLRSKSQYFTAAKKINSDHVDQWLETERATAIGSGQMAGKWVTIQEQKKFLPILEYDAVLDGRTTDLCRSLDGVRKPVDDAFWNTYFPPNHFGERATVRQQSGGRITPDAEIVHPEKIPPMFKTNLAKNGLAFPAGHPYWVGCPPEVLAEALTLLPYDSQFALLEQTREGWVRRHMLVSEQGADYAYLKELAGEQARKGAKVDLLPILHESDPTRATIFPDALPRKSPDLRINGLLWEVERPLNPKSLNNLKHAIDAGAKQAGHVIIYLMEEISEQHMRRVVLGRFKDHKGLKMVVFRYKGQYKPFTRPE